MPKLLVSKLLVPKLLVPKCWLPKLLVPKCWFLHMCLPASFNHLFIVSYTNTFVVVLFYALLIFIHCFILLRVTVRYRNY